MTKKQTGEERVHLAYTLASLFITEESQDRNSGRTGAWRQELMQRLWRRAAYCLASHDLLSPLSYRTQGQQPRDDTTTMGWASFIDCKMRKYLTAASQGGIFSAEALPLMTPACVKLTHKTSQYRNCIN